MISNGILLSPDQHRALTLPEILEHRVYTFLERRDREIAELDGRLTPRKRYDIQHSARMDAAKMVRDVLAPLTRQEQTLLLAHVTCRPACGSVNGSEEGGDRLAQLIASVK